MTAERDYNSLERAITHPGFQGNMLPLSTIPHPFDRCCSCRLQFLYFRIGCSSQGDEKGPVMLVRLAAASVLSLALAFSSTAGAQQTAPRLAKSATVYLADIETHAITGRKIYLPAGVKMLLFDKQARRDANKWMLALTEDGIYAYVRDRVHFFNPTQMAVMQNPPFAIVIEPFPLTVEGIPMASLSQSEVYPVAQRFDFTAAILVGSAKFPDLRDKELRIQVPEESLRIFEAEEIADLAAPISPFRRKTFTEDFRRLREELAEGGFDDDAKEKVMAFLDRKLITEKSCEQVIEGKIEIGAELSVKLDAIFSPLDAKFGGSGSLKSSFTFEKNSSFVIERFARDLEGGGELVIEVKNEELRENCADAMKSRRFVISSSRRESAEVSSKTIADLNMKLLPDGYIEVRCRAEFLKLFNDLISRNGLERDTAFLFMTYFTRFTGGSDPSACTLSS
jgi:hypothetical protein